MHPLLAVTRVSNADDAVQPRSERKLRAYVCAVDTSGGP